MKFFRTGLLVLVLLLVVLVVGGLTLGGDPLFASALRTYGPGATGQPIDFTDARLSVLGGSAGIDGLLVGTPEHPVLEASAVAFDASTFDLLAGRLHLLEASLDGAVLHLVVDQNGRLSIDPGPPPPEVTAEKPPRERPGREEVPAEERDFVQIVREYWERLQDYEEYYDDIGAVFGGDEDPAAAEERAARTRSAHPGRASYLGDAEEEGLSFWLGRAALTGFRWETRDERTGQPLLPPIDSLTLTAERLGDAPEGETGPTSLVGQGRFTNGGEVDFQLDLARDGTPSRLKLKAGGIPVESVVHLVAKSLPYRLKSGTIDLDTRQLRFTDQSLSGKVKVKLVGVELGPTPRSPEVLGLKPKEFTRLLNQALASAPVAFDFVLGGTPTEPSFDIENETSLKDLLTGAVKAEIEDRGKKLLDEKKDELLQGKDAKDVLGGLLGGDDKKPSLPKKGNKKGGG